MKSAPRVALILVLNAVAAIAPDVLRGQAPSSWPPELLQTDHSVVVSTLV
jgi:hypothetical protein